MLGWSNPKGDHEVTSTQNAPIAIAPPGLEGLAVAETEIGDVAGREGFYHYRQYSAVDLAAGRAGHGVDQIQRERLSDERCGDHPLMLPKQVDALESDT